MNWIIRPAVAADAVSLSGLAERTYRDAFTALNTEENMTLHCASSYSPALQLAEIVHPGILTLVAATQDELVAFAQLHWNAARPACVLLWFDQFPPAFTPERTATPFVFALLAITVLPRFGCVIIDAP
jgi:hypothetical protein